MTATDKVKSKIIFLMSENNESQRQLAKKAGVPVTTLNNLLKNRVKSPTLETVEKIANSYNMTLQEFLKD